MIIRKATYEDIPFLIKGILAIENTGNSNTFSNMFETDYQTTYNYLKQFFLDEENLNTELSLNVYSVAEVEGETSGFCALIHTDSNYYQNKSELFPIHLKTEHLNSFIKNVRCLPDTKNHSENKFFIENIFVNENFRGRGIGKSLIEYQLREIQADKAYLNVLQNNIKALRYYKKLDFQEYLIFSIDNPENKIYPSTQKIILYKNLKIN
ncbi:GNAT family N-acetyltransferase [Chryseobacterium wangxinyae]|uniref:GNAT family N-acetyltransferase n=1 Tax=Chryseobacterium sp. CY353 TaxID=2997334 RepID=UPI00226FF7D5|nr:GNAT family N-acetyltransferase [Chryseobacterium sp. CY353]MCY0969576.1 GNAT family N-acetyltransferase [Chryseobacterium sp. CY353]